MIPEVQFFHFNWKKNEFESVFRAYVTFSLYMFDACEKNYEKLIARLKCFKIYYGFFLHNMYETYMRAFGMMKLAIDNFYQATL